MKLNDLVDRCAELNIKLQPEGNRLRFRAPKGVLTEPIKAELSRHRSELIAHLRSQNAADKSDFPLSYGQKALWFIQMSAPESSAFNVAFAARVRSAVDQAALRNAFQALLDRHAALRTTFTIIEGRPAQVRHGAMGVAFETVDAAGWSEKALETEVARASKAPIDLESGPIMRVHLFTRTETDHVLLITTHHIACDGWSIWILLDELRDLYRTEAHNLQSALPLPAAQYSDFVAWEAANLDGPRGAELHAFWETQFSDDPPALDLPLDRPRPRIQKFIGRSRPVFLEPSLSGRIKQLAFAEDATVFMLLLAAYGVLLHRHCGQDLLVVGTPTFGRHRPEFEPIVGCLINQVALRLDFQGDLTFKQFLARTRKTVLEAMANQDYPFHLVAENFWKSSDRSVPPVCQVEFIFQKGQQSNDLSKLFNPENDNTQIDFGGLLLGNFPMTQQEGQLDLTLEMLESDGALIGSLKFNAEIFDDQSIARMIDEYRSILATVVQNPDLPIGAIPLVSESDHYRILAELSGPPANDMAPTSPMDLIADKVAQTPDATAVVHDQESMTYGELGRRSNQLARYLRDSGVGPNVIVGLFFDRSIEMIVALLAILKSGGAYLPLDPSFPPERVNFMISDARVTLVVTTSRLSGRLGSTSTPSLSIDTQWDVIRRQPPAELESRPQASHLAYIIYTSGSTGTPKGVMVPHRALWNFVTNAIQLYAITPADKVLQFASINFDASVEEIFPCLSQGATLVLRTDSMLESMDLFFSRCRDWNISVLDLPTAFWHELTLSLNQGAGRLPESIRLVIIGGEKAHRETLVMWKSCVPPAIRLLNTYGPTESTVVATVCDLSMLPKPAPEMTAVPIGRPIANVQAYILDRHMQPVPVGVFGELHLGGAGLADGYLFRPELTAEKFVRHQFEGMAPTRLYKTGDLARFHADGQIEYKGRIDSQVKIRGFRVETGEIESLLLKHPDVENAFVMTHDPGDRAIVLVAYVVTSMDHARAAEELRQYLKQTLPDYMIPSRLIPIDLLPRTLNGKIDVRALPAPSPHAPQMLVAPRSPIERKMANIWSAILSIEEIGINQDFFSLGGHSLLLLRLTTIIKNEFGVDLPFRQFFESPTILELSKYIEAVTYLAEGSKAISACDATREEVEI